jgi:hypothetical protein
MLSFQSNKKYDRQQYQKAIYKILLDSRQKPLRSEFDVGMANYKKFSYLILKKYLIRPTTKPENVQTKQTSSFVV